MFYIRWNLLQDERSFEMIALLGKTRPLSEPWESLVQQESPKGRLERLTC